MIRGPLFFLSSVYYNHYLEKIQLIHQGQGEAITSTHC